jgi:hypothetical protein
MKLCYEGEEATRSQLPWREMTTVELSRLQQEKQYPANKKELPVIYFFLLRNHSQPTL